MIPMESRIALPHIVPSLPVLDRQFMKETPNLKGLVDPEHHEDKPSWLEAIRYRLRG